MCSMVIAVDAFFVCRVVGSMDGSFENREYFHEKCQNRDDSLLYETYYRLMDENPMNPTIKGMLFHQQRCRDYFVRAKCSVFLSHVKSHQDSMYIEKVMLAPFNGTSTKYYKEELRNRITQVSQYLAIE